MTPQPLRVAILGSTGSIGTQTLDIVRAHPDRFTVVALASGRPSPLFLEQIAEFQPLLVAARDEGLLALEGSQHADLVSIVTDPNVDLVVIATPGGAGIEPTIRALEAGKPVALANKEALVAAGALATSAARRSGASILPIDSEHSAIWQCLHDAARITPPCLAPAGVERLILTASGGAFRDRPIQEVGGASAAEALLHPNWTMGPKVTIDSATLVNKGFELIEAYWLFGLPYERLDVVIHRESIVHSFVEFVDGSIKAQLGQPDMHLPIQYALTFPDRLPNANLPRLDLAALGRLTFSPPDSSRYPCLGLVVEAGKKAGTYPAVVGGADEAAVELFLGGRICFGDIAALIASVLDAHKPDPKPDIEAILAADEWARTLIRELAEKAS